MKLSVALTIALVALATRGLQAQDSKARAREIPANERPPAGMCRIWLDDVPPAQQPAPTDCATAVRNRPAKGRVIFGDDYVDKNKKADSSKSKSPIKGFAPSSSSKNRKPPF